MSDEFLVLCAMVTVLSLAGIVRSCHIDRECIKRNNCIEMGINKNYSDSKELRE